MRDRRVVCDSEDEDESFDSITSPIAVRTSAVVTTAESEDGARLVHVDDVVSDSRSTDPEFFRQIYENQQRQKAPSWVTVPDTAEAGRQGSSDKQKSSRSKAKDNSSSITDPATGSSKKKTMREPEAKNCSSLTEVTTPSAPSAKQKDVYDFPLSDEEGVSTEPAFSKLRAKRASTANAKRKRDKHADVDLSTAARRPSRQSSRAPGSSPSRAIEIEDDTSPRAAKKRKDVRPEEEHQDSDQVDLLAVSPVASMLDTPKQADESPGTNNQTSINHDISDMPATSKEQPPASFFIDPLPRLSTSQREEYLRLSGSSEIDDLNHEQPSLPQPKPLGTQAQLPPNTDSTILYTTPSRYCPSAPPLPLISSSHLATSSTTEQPRAAHPQSSPDELTSHAPEQMGRSTKRKREHLEHSDAPQDDSWDSDKVGFHRESYVPRPSRRRSRAVLELGEDGNASAQSMPDTCPPGHDSSDHLESGNLLSTSHVDHAPEDDVEGTDGIADLDPEFLQAMPEDIRREIIANHASARALQAPKTRSRGRPSKSSGGFEPAVEEIPQPKKRGRKKKQPCVEDTAAPAGEANETAGPAPVANTAKRKRGRPKKADVAQSPDVTHIDESASVVGAVEPEHVVLHADVADAPTAESAQNDEATPTIRKAPSKRGRKKKVVEDSIAPQLKESKAGLVASETTSRIDEAPDTEPHDHINGSKEAAKVESEREALQDISNQTSQNTPAASKSSDKLASQDVVKKVEATPEPQGKDSLKSVSTSTPGQQGKVPFRVGLSKKTRIAPLLKMIRK